MPLVLPDLDVSNSSVSVSDLDSDTLSKEIERGVESIKRLEASNVEMAEMARLAGSHHPSSSMKDQEEMTRSREEIGKLDDDDKRELEKAVKENEDVISRKRVTVSQMIDVLKGKDGSHAVPEEANEIINGRGEKVSTDEGMVL